MFCKNCGHQLQAQAAFCPDCGQKQDTAERAQPEQTNPPSAYQLPQQPQYAPAPPVKIRKGRGLRVFLIILAVLIAGAAGTYFLLPGLSKPVDLGIRSSREAYERAMSKLGIDKDTAPESGESDDYIISYGELRETEASLTSEELTSFFNENRPPYYAVKNVQVRINEDGTIEASGNLDTSYVFDRILNGQYSRDDAQSALPMLGLVPDTVNVYLKFSGSVVNNHVEGFDVDAVSVMGIPIPKELIVSNAAFIVNTLDDFIARENARVGTNIERVEIAGGKLSLDGALPASVDRIPAE
jgi:hypothetical protein